MKKRLFIPILVVTLILAIFLASAVGVFVDRGWSNNERIYANEAGLIPDGLLEDIKGDITRQEFCRLIVNTYKALEQPLPDNPQMPFTDTDDESVATAYALGLIEGTSYSTFGPGGYITREEMALLMFRLAKKVGFVAEKAALTEFSDADTVSPWAEDALSYMVGGKVIRGMDGKLRPARKTTREQAIVMAWRLFELLKSGKVNTEGTNPGQLAELGIISADKIQSEDYITTEEALFAIGRGLGRETTKGVLLSRWYEGDTLARLDHIPDDTKRLLLGLTGQILTYEEIADLNPGDAICREDALLYLIRMVSDRYGCIVYTAYSEVDGAADVDVYGEAYKKGIIPTPDPGDAQEPVSYREFCTLLHRTLYVKHSQGSVAGSFVARRIDYLSRQAAEPTSSPSPKVEKKAVLLPVKVSLHDGLSAAWTLPEDYQFLAQENYQTSFELLGRDGKRRHCFTAGSTMQTLETDDFLSDFLFTVPADWKTLRCTYSHYLSDTEYYFDIDLSHIRVQEAGEAPKPGKYETYQNSWVLSELSLAEGETFAPDCYYLLKGYEHKHRKPEYNSVSCVCFRVTKEESTYKPWQSASFGVSSGGMDDVRIRKVRIQPGAGGEVLLTVTPESAQSFRHIESGVSLH